MKVRDILIDRIIIGKNVRSDPDEQIGEMMKSMEMYDQLQPVIVRPAGERYELISGFRRVAAAKMRNERTIAANIIDVADSKVPWIRLTENMVRKDLSTRELIECVDGMKRDNPEISDTAVSRLIGKCDGYISGKRKSYRSYQQLMEAGVPEDVVNELNDLELLRAAPVTNRKIRAPSDNRNHHESGEDLAKQTGFQILIGGPRKLIIVSRDTGIHDLIQAILMTLKGKIVAHRHLGDILPQAKKEA